MPANPSAARRIGPVDPSETVDVVLLLRPGRPFPQDAVELGTAAIGDRKHVTGLELSQRLRPRQDAVQAVRRFATKHRLKVRSVDLRRRLVRLRGRARDVANAFGVDLSRYASRTGARSNDREHVFRGHEHALKIPRELEPAVSGVFGLDTRPVSRRPRFDAGAALLPPPVNPRTKPPSAFRRLYAFPARATGRRECIGVLEFGGGFTPRKLRAYLAKLGGRAKAGARAPRVIVREIGSGRNRPVNQPGTLSPDVEVYMDLEILAGVAPGATLVVYFAENSNRGWIEALHAAIFDDRYPLSVLSISWGQAEQYWDAQTIAAIDEALRLAALRGITVCCSSGDRGVFEAGKRPYTVPFPASSPFVLACGGTELDASAGGRARESVWNESRTVGLTSGGGVSRAFDRPAFQDRYRVPALFGTKRFGRGTPDVAANASSKTGYLILADDTPMSIGGTSAAAPLWAGLIACINEALGRRTGYLTPLLYTGGAQRHGALRDIRAGDNRMSGRQGYKARPGWDPCTGLGSPHGAKLLKWLKSTSGTKD